MELLTTERIRFRRFNAEDFANLFRLDSDPQVMKYIGNGAPANQEQIRQVLNSIISKYNDWKAYGL